MPSFAPLVRSVAAVGLIGCATYSPGSFAARGETFAGQLVTTGCLDLAVNGTRDVVAPGPIVEFQFGNRCDHAVHVDLGAVRATGRTSKGERVALVPYDPYGELARQKLEARSIGRERLEYRSARDFGIDLIEVCVEVGGITEGGVAAMVCVTPEHDRVAEVTP